ncbi:MAG: hypothetical protein JNL79_40610 [Myxococcales bacterium]|nr:hypothetical protein [Myxococcales bacterium]
MLKGFVRAGLVLGGVAAIVGIASLSVSRQHGVQVAPAAAGDESVNIEGAFKVTGVGADGGEYTGSATLKKIGGQMFKGTWNLGKKFEGVCFRDGSVLSCGWSAKHDLGVMAYLVKDNGDLDGVWFEEGNTTIGKEYLVGGNGNLLGNYTIKTGEEPPKGGAKAKTYSGTVKVGFHNGVYTFDWNFGGGKKLSGLGLRDGDVVSVGFNDTGNYGVLQYDIKGGAGKKTTLVGRWVESGTSNKGPGAETMVK